MIRKIIHIDEGKCNGCGLCAKACHEGAIDLVDGKARLVREHFCDGFGDCLPNCPAGAITFEEREAPAYDEAAVKAAQAASRSSASREAVPSRLTHWPVQLKLVSPTAPYFNGADLLVAADCSAFAYAAFHEHFMSGRVTVIGCPKLDAVDYAEKLSAIFTGNDIRSITIVRMEVPCCGGLENAVKRAILACGKRISCHTIVLSGDGKIIKD